MVRRPPGKAPACSGPSRSCATAVGRDSRSPVLHEHHSDLVPRLRELHMPRGPAHGRASSSRRRRLPTARLVVSPWRAPCQMPTLRRANGLLLLDGAPRFMSSRKSRSPMTRHRVPDNELCDGTGEYAPHHGLPARWQERVPCPICGRSVALTQSHTIPSHRPKPPRPTRPLTTPIEPGPSGPRS